MAKSAARIQVVEEPNLANPYARLLVGGYRRTGRSAHLSVAGLSRDGGQVIHLQWPETLLAWRRAGNRRYRSAPEVALRDLKERQKSAPLVYTVHNLEPHNTHDPSILALYAAIVTLPDIFVHHGQSSIAPFVSRYPQTRERVHLVAKHGPYPAPTSHQQADFRQGLRKAIGLEYGRRLVLNFGRQRPNKHYSFMDDIASRLPSSEFAFLSIGRSSGPPAGSPLQQAGLGVIRAIRHGLARHRSATINARPSNRLSSRLFAAADVVLLPHTGGINSGVLSLAISHGCRVVYPDLGNLRHQSGAWVHAYAYRAGDPQSAAEALIEAFDAPDDDTHASWRLWLQENSWERHAEVVGGAIDSFNESS